MQTVDNIRSILAFHTTAETAHVSVIKLALLFVTTATYKTLATFDLIQTEKLASNKLQLLQYTAANKHSRMVITR